MATKLGACLDCRGNLWQDEASGKPERCDPCIDVATQAKGKGK